MEDCNQLLAVLGDDGRAQEWAGAFACIKKAFTELPMDAKANLVTGDVCIPAFIHAMERNDGSDKFVIYVAASAALDALIIGLPTSLKQSLLSCDKGDMNIVSALLRGLGDSNRKVVWNQYCFILSNLINGLPSNAKEALLSDGRGIVESIVGALQNDESDSFSGVQAALHCVFDGLTVNTRQSLVMNENDIMRVLLHQLSDCKFNGSWTAACSAIVDLLFNLPSSAKSLFLRSQPQLVTNIISRLEREDTQSCWRFALTLLKRLVYQEPSLSHINLCTLDFLRNDCGIMAVLLRCSHQGFSNDADNENFTSVCDAISGLCFTASFPPFTGPSLQILAKLLSAAQLCSHDKPVRAFVGLLSNFSINVNYCYVLVLAKCHEYVLSKITGVPPADAVWSDAYSVATKSLATALYLCRNVSLHTDLKRLNITDIMASLAVPGCVCETRALMALSYLIGCKESDHGGERGALTQLSNSDSICKIVDCLENTLNLKGGPGYAFGGIMLPATLQALSELSCSDRNKTLMGSLRLTRLLAQSLRLFVDEKPPLISATGNNAEGGGTDLPSARYAVITLAQLSFLHESDDSLLTLMPPELQLPSLLEAFAASPRNKNIPDNALDRSVADIGDDARQQARSLAKRLSLKIANHAISSPETFAAQHQRKHVMLSYCWADTAKPNLVKALGQLLKNEGIDVWRDEVGSSLVGPMSDSTDETMALAVEASSVVVICVSQKYKVSPNCRQEAAYARQLEKKGRMKLVYVMMQEEYTTVSQPDSIDGWLAVQLSDKLWFPCWNTTVMTDTATRIVHIITAQERVSLNSPLATTLSSSPSNAAPISAPSSTADNVNTATDFQMHAVTNASSLVPASAFFMAPLEQKVYELSKRIDELADNSTPTSTQNPKNHEAIEALMANQQAVQNELISSLRLFQDVLNAHSKQQDLFFSPASMSKMIYMQCACIALLSMVLLLILSLIWRG